MNNGGCAKARAVPFKVAPAAVAGMLIPEEDDPSADKVDFPKGASDDRAGIVANELTLGSVHEGSVVGFSFFEAEPKAKGNGSSTDGGGTLSTGKQPFDWLSDIELVGDGTSDGIAQVVSDGIDVELPPGLTERDVGVAIGEGVGVAALMLVDAVGSTGIVGAGSDVCVLFDTITAGTGSFGFGSGMAAAGAMASGARNGVGAGFIGSGDVDASLRAPGRMPLPDADAAPSLSVLDDRGRRVDGSGDTMHWRGRREAFDQKGSSTMQKRHKIFDMLRSEILPKK